MQQIEDYLEEYIDLWWELVSTCKFRDMGEVIVLIEDKCNHKQ